MPEAITGVFEPGQKDGGHLRAPEAHYRIRAKDAVVPPDLCRALGLRGGETLVGKVGPQAGRNGARPPQIIDVLRINERSVEDYREIKPFEQLTAIKPDRPIRFETPGGPLTTRVVDLMTPIGLGQRGLIVAPPRTGKTVLLQQMAEGVATNHPEIEVIVLLIDERPEEVTDMRRRVHGEVIASSNDEDAQNHLRMARFAIAKAKRMVECGRDVLILMDSLTRLGRTFNTKTRGSGRVMSGGLAIEALTEPKSIFGAARNAEEGGSLTIIASALIETGSRMDEVIFNEFKGTGNMEITLCRELANRRVWPAIDLERSGTRNEDRLLSAAALEVTYRIRRSLSGKGAEPAMLQLLEALAKFPDNGKFVSEYSDVLMR